MARTRKNKRRTIPKTRTCQTCPHCGPNCYCGPKCDCPKECPGNCYLNKPMRKRKQRGGHNCGPYGCPLAPLSWGKMMAQQNGGQCVMGCGPILGTGQNGGSGFYKPPAPIPGPFVGQPTSGFVSEWPSVDGISGNRNYYDMNLYKSDPQTMMKVGGTHHKKRSNTKRRGRGRSRSRGKARTQKGGLTSLAPQELVNLGRELNFNYQSAYNSLNGYPAPVSPEPWKGQLQPSTK